VEHVPPKHAYRIVVGALASVAVIIVVVTIALVVASRPPSAEAIAATLTAMPTPTPTLTPTPTPIPTIPAVSGDLLLCQREAGRAMNARSMVGTVNISGDHLLLMSWVSTEWQIIDLDDALSGVIMGFDVALDVWQRGCAVYDRVQIDVYDGPGDSREHRLTVHAPMDDLLKWRGGEFTDKELIARLQVTRP
jgi:hypothetical protein